MHIVRVFGPVYEKDAFYPAELASLGRPYVMRDYRGVTVTVNPFQYNPVKRILRVYTEMTVVVGAVGADEVGVGHEAEDTKCELPIWAST